ncbi:mitochondrial K+-H+ exchange-related-domain-containing protein [Crepidotus variabilis]|uniref:Mitochondrial K+-H+ exchange-related-domain-containing protein n=1 Tax=Crepidotus variabilis TaxID=179855 RepID=A0A9P6JJM5_9AGAR|nr:mitochondrial K+-H+ exchange-related-domain-containing protein [Crepidotus variabilis]
MSTTKLRIVAIPLTRPRALARSFPSASGFGAGGSTTSTEADPSKPNGLTYYQFQISNKRERKSGSSSASSTSSSTSTPSSSSSNTPSSASWLTKLKSLKYPEEGIVQFASVKASQTWAGFGRAEGGWKLKTYQMGEKLRDRLDFEELALGSIDPALGPSITSIATGSKTGSTKNGAILKSGEKVDIKIPLLYPPSILSPSSALSSLHASTTLRIPQHRRGFWIWMVIAPFTAPFMVIPVIPNLPFFFCVWRSWGHWRAYKASEYLASLLDHGMIVPQGSKALDAVYARSVQGGLVDTKEHLEEKTPEQKYTPDAEHKHDILLTKDDVPRLVEFLKGSFGSSVFASSEATETSSSSSSSTVNSDDSSTLSSSGASSPSSPSIPLPESTSGAGAGNGTSSTKDDEDTDMDTNIDASNIYRAVEQAQTRVESGREV